LREWKIFDQVWPGVYEYRKDETRDGHHHEHIAPRRHNLQQLSGDDGCKTKTEQREGALLKPKVESAPSRS
jgi:hypothetical protein